MQAKVLLYAIEKNVWFCLSQEEVEEFSGNLVKLIQICEKKQKECEE